MAITQEKYRVICPTCLNERYVSYFSMWDMKKGRNSGICKSCSKTPEHREKLRKMLMGNKRTLGYRHTLASKIKIGIASARPRPDISGSNSPMWKGGVSSVNKLIRQSREYREWHRKVLARDFHTCQKCGQKGGNLHVDHVMPFAFYPELRFDLLNGRTLCAPCHKLTDSFGKIKNTFEPIWQ